MSSGLSGIAVLRAAQAMLQALGGATVTVLFPQVQMPNDPAAQLGLLDPGVEQVDFYPVIGRNLVTPNTGPRRRMEFLFSATAVALVVVDRNVASAEALFQGSLGLLFQGDLFHIESLTPEYFAGNAYMYRVLAVE